MLQKGKNLLSLLLCGTLVASLLTLPIHTHVHDDAMEDLPGPGSVPLAAAGDVLGTGSACTNPAGHKFAQVEETNPQSVGFIPECPKATVYQLKCAYCSAERGYYGGKHDWSDWTASSDGTRSRICALCNAEQTETVTAPSHTHTLVTVTIPATCTKDGVTYEMCTRCDYKGPETSIPATGHKAVDDDDCRTPPHCSVCGELLWDGKTYPAIHNFSGAYEYDENGHWQHCRNEGCSAVSAKTPHRTTGGVGDCTKGDVCSECGAVASANREHSFEDAKVGVTTEAGHYLICANPGCGQTGFFAHSFSTGKCTVCGQADPDYKPSPEPGAQQEQPVTQGTQATQTAPETQAPQESQTVSAAQTAPVAQETIPVAASKFSDVTTGKWYAGDVQRVVDAGLMSGVSATSFAPNTNVNRAMLTTILYRLAGEPGTGNNSFADVKATAYYADAVSWAADKGIVTGVGNQSFLPNQDITRQELAVILYRYAKQAGYAVSGTDGLGAFADQDRIASWAYDAMAWANRVGIMGGRNGNRLSPTDTATRAEVATMIARFMDLAPAGEPDQPSGPVG